ncbi:MAG TPA: hypothetical protein VNB67_05820 [Nitrososphaeraceae archaeon]|nr:hypothetical protein [Nitrososphaeraceae archaeon]
MVETKEVLLKMELKIDIPQDIMLDKKRLKSVQRGILKAISKGPYEEGLAFKIVKATFVDFYSPYDLPKNKNQPSPEESGF